MTVMVFETCTIFTVLIPLRIAVVRKCLGEGYILKYIKETVSFVWELLARFGVPESRFYFHIVLPIMDNYSFATSQKGKEKLVFREHIYRHQRSRGQNHYFRCEDKNWSGAATLCGVSFFNEQGGSITEGKAHNHAPLAGRNEILQSIAELKNQAKNSDATPAAIIQETRQKVNIN